MANSFPEINTPAELADKIADILVKGSLYRKFIYSGLNCHLTRIGQYREEFRYAVLPGSLRMFCDFEDCRHETKWNLDEQGHDFFFNSSPQARTYVCCNCSSNRMAYWINWQENAEGGIFIKVGQWPPLAIQPMPELAKALGNEDSELYRKALINANFAHGIGALAYFRRVIENKANYLLDLIAEAAKHVRFEHEQLNIIEEIKKSQYLDQKIDYASKILPIHLRPGGHNPLIKLYGIASAGLHGESDEKCLELFDTYKFEFEYLFRNLTISNAEAQEYVKRVGAPVLKKRGN